MHHSVELRKKQCGVSCLLLSLHRFQEPKASHKAGMASPFTCAILLAMENGSFLPKVNLGYFYSCMCTHTCMVPMWGQHAPLCMEARGQLCGICFLLSISWLWRLNSGCQELQNRGPRQLSHLCGTWRMPLKIKCKTSQSTSE